MIVPAYVCFSVYFQVRVCKGQTREREKYCCECTLCRPWQKLSRKRATKRGVIIGDMLNHLLLRFTADSGRTV